MFNFRSLRKLIYLLLILVLINHTFSCCTTESVIQPEEGYNWPSTQRPYWPTNGWETASMEDHNIDPLKMELADRFAQNDDLSRSLLVVKDGYLVFEKYYGDGGVDQSTNLWSVTKSFTSALVGLLMDKGYVQSTDQLMADLMPQYPAFNSISLDNVLTQTTGLAWSEEGQLWVDWIFSEDWVAEALARGQINEPGKKFYYSSGNSHFLTALVNHMTQEQTGEFANEHLFKPLGINFQPLSQPIRYYSWNEYKLPLDQSWRQDPMGIETAGFGLYLTARDMAKFGFLYINQGQWDGRSILSKNWVNESTKDQVTNIYGRYSYGYQWWITHVAGYPSFLASGFGGQIIGIVPSLDLVVVLKYEAENPSHPKSGTDHDDMHLFELVVRSVKE